MTLKIKNKSKRWWNYGEASKVIKLRATELSAKEQLKEFETEWNRQAEENEDLARKDLIGNWDFRDQWEWWKEYNVKNDNNNGTVE